MGQLHAPPAADARGVTVTGDGRIMLAGELRHYDPQCGPGEAPIDSDSALAALTADGTLDAALDADGRLVAHLTCYPSGVHAAVLDYGVGPDGNARLVVGGWTGGFSWGFSFALLARFTVAPLSERVWAVTDAAYNIVTITDSAGYAVERYVYDPYGAREPVGPAIDLPDGAHTITMDTNWRHGWHGGEHVLNAEAVYFRHRFLHTNLDVWMSWDPLKYPDGANTYTPMRGDAVRGVDPWGLAGVTLTEADPATEEALAAYARQYPPIANIGGLTPTGPFDAYGDPFAPPVGPPPAISPTPRVVMVNLGGNGPNRLADEIDNPKWEAHNRALAEYEKGLRTWAQTWGYLLHDANGELILQYLWVANKEEMTAFDMGMMIAPVPGGSIKRVFTAASAAAGYKFGVDVTCGRDVGEAATEAVVSVGTMGIAHFVGKWIAGKVAPLARVLDGHTTGQGFTAVYDAERGVFGLAPSTTKEVIPTGWVARSGGHDAVSTAIGGNRAKHWGFAAILQPDGSVKLTWRSGTLNNTVNNEVPLELRDKIASEFEKMIGRWVSEY